VPTGAILTYPAAGSEASNGAVITNEDGLYKRPVQSESMRPKFAILNPELTLSLPKELTAIGVGDWASHDIEHELSAIYDIPHGTGLSIVMPAWMLYVYSDAPARFAAFAEQVFGVHDSSQSVEAIALQGINKLKAFFDQIGLPTHFGQVNIDQSRFSEMAKKCTQNGLLGNFKELNEEDVINILNLAM